MSKKIFFLILSLLLIFWLVFIIWKESSDQPQEEPQEKETQRVDYSIESLKEPDAEEKDNESNSKQAATDKLVAVLTKDKEEKSSVIWKIIEKIPGNQSSSDDEKAMTPPEKLYVDSVSDTRIAISWDPVAWAKWYNITKDGKYVSTVNEGYKYEDIDIIAEKIYVYQVSAYANDDYSPNSTKFRVKASKWGIDTSQAPAYPSIDWKEASQYKLAFFDEFNGQSLNVNKWNTAFLWWADTPINNEEQYYVDIHWVDQNKALSPFIVKDGSLEIRAKKIPKWLQRQYGGKPYVSWIITSYDAFKFTHGYAEARLKIPKGQWLWPAFWLLNAYYDNGLRKPEIDIMENLWHESTRAYQTYHYFNTADKLISTESHVDEKDYSENFHTYAVDWQPGLIQFYIDGKKHNSITWESVASEEMYVLANLAVGWNWPWSPDETTKFPASYMIDWIRVYEKK